jgi:hypothetical protein
MEQIIRSLETQLAHARAQLEIEKNKLNAQVIKMADKDTDAYKTGWKEIVEYGVVENVEGILKECYSHLCEESPTAREQMGEVGSETWELFLLKVIQKLKDEGSFGNVRDGFDDFEDTAGGCDEITWDAALDLLRH